MLRGSQARVFGKAAKGDSAESEFKVFKVSFQRPCYFGLWDVYTFGMTPKWKIVYVYKPLSMINSLKSSRVRAIEC